MASFNVFAHELYGGLGYSYGMSIWNIAVLEAPYRTGNLRRSIYLQANTDYRKRIFYDDVNAYYLNFLEEGRGRNKKHRGFIENDTVNAILSETLGYISENEVTFRGVPTVYLKTDRARNYERQLLQRANVSLDKRLTANDRAMLSKMHLRATTQRRTSNTSKMIKPNVDAYYAQNRKLSYGYRGTVTEVKD